MCSYACVAHRNARRLVNGDLAETLLLKVDTGLETLAPASLLWRLPTLIYDPDPQTETLLVTSLKVTDRDRHTPVPDQLCKETSTNGVFCFLSCLSPIGSCQEGLQKLKQSFDMGGWPREFTVCWQLINVSGRIGFDSWEIKDSPSFLTRVYRKTHGLLPVSHIGTLIFEG